MDIRSTKIINNEIHLVILGAGASMASTLLNPEASGKVLPSMRNIASIIDIEDILSKIPVELQDDNFETLYSNIYDLHCQSTLLSEINRRIYNYFASLKLPLHPTIYDYLVMSLREKDVIATFNWDPFLYQAWWRNYLHGSSPRLIFLHGNVAIGYNENIDTIGWANSIGKQTGKYFEAVPLLYPTKHKNYNQCRFIAREWEHLYSSVEYAKRITIYGYSAPKSDEAAIQFLKDAWGDVWHRNMEQFEIIDVRPEEEVKCSWENFIYSHHYDYYQTFFQSSIAQYPRRTIEAYKCQYLPSIIEDAFVEANPIPNNGFHTFEEMWKWFEPLIRKEHR